MIKVFGFVSVPVPGTQVRATVNVTTGDGPTGRQGVQGVRIQVHPGNTGLVYVFQGNGAGDHRTDLEGIVAILTAPVDALEGPFDAVTLQLSAVPAGINVNDLWIDAGVAEDGAIVTGLV